MKLLLILFIFNCGKGSTKDSSNKESKSPRYITPDEDFQSRREEEEAVEDEAPEKNYYEILINNNINVNEVLEEIKNDKRISIIEKENLLENLIKSREIGEEKKLFLIKELYSPKIDIAPLINSVINLIDNSNAEKYRSLIRFLIGKSLKEFPIETIFENFVVRINNLDLKDRTIELEKIGKILIDRYFEIKTSRTGELFVSEAASIKFVEEILEVYLNLYLPHQEINKEMILYIINKIEDNPLSANKKKLIEDLKEKYKKNSFILDLVFEEIK